MPSRSGRPTDRRSRRATWFGAIATPRRGRSTDSPRPSASTRAWSAASAGKCQVEALADPVRVQADQLAPRRRRARRRTSPGASGAVCSMLPAIRRPPGPRNDARPDDTKPNVTRAPPPIGRRRAEDGLADARRAVGTPVDRCRAGRVDRDDREVAVGVDAADLAAVDRPSSNVMVTSRPRRLWALVRTWPSATTTPEPRPSRPTPTMDGPIRGRRRRRSAFLSSSMRSSGDSCVWFE